ncbi:MAG: hypothetical protein ACOC16_03045 [Nanoarchaeota archaeon]
MKKRLISVLFVFVFLMLFLVIIYNLNINNNKNNEINEKTNETFILGFCPTMEEYAQEISLKNDNVEIKKYLSTIDVLNDLNKNKIDIALVGRVAKQNELKAEYNELKLRNGFTLVTSRKNMVYHDKLSEIKIHTYINKQKVDDFLGENYDVVFYDNIKQLNSVNYQEVFLIDWKDYNDNYELLIPVDENNKKIEKFRVPVLYSYMDLEKFNLI